MFAD
jgi:hypothetical protein